MEDKKIKVTVVILYFGKLERTISNVEFLLAQKTLFAIKIIVIDNSGDHKSADILKEKLKVFSNVELIVNTHNLGYSRGENVIRGKEEGQYLLTVNPDILFKEGDTLQKMVDYMDSHTDIAILGPQQINDNGEIAITVRAFPKFYLQVARRTFLKHLPYIKKKVAYDEMHHLDHSKIQDVDWLQSSCYIIRRSFWEKIGGFNEYYFIFMADTEMCWRAWELGYRVVYYPRTRVWADGKRISEGGLRDFFSNWIMRQHVIDSIKYRLKYFWKRDPRKKYYRKNNIAQHACL